MTRTSVDLVADVGLSGGELNGTVDVTAALFDPTHGSNSAEDLCRQYGVKKVTMPSSCKLLISKQKATWFPQLDQPIAKPTWARDWLGDPGTWGADDGTRLALDTVPAGYVTGTSILTIFEWDNTTNGALKFRMDAQAAKQMNAYHQPDHNGAGKLVGFAVNGIRSTGATDPDIAVSFLNFRSRNPSGYGSAFCCEMIQGVRGNFWQEFDVQDGSFGSECIVFHGYTFSGGGPWHLNHVRSRRMWRGWGCFNGGQGEVRDLQTWDLHAPGGTTSNIEAGLDKTDSAGHVIAQGGTPGPILLYAPKSTNGGIYLNINNNYGNKVGNVQLIGGTSANDDACITLTSAMGNSAGAPAGGAAVGLYCSDAFFDTPKAEILHLQSPNGEPAAVATDVHMTRCKYRPSTAKKVSSGSVPGAWDLTFGSGTNLAPVLSAMNPADGSTVGASTSVTVSCTASDDHDSPASGLTAAGQVYLPAVTVTSITVSSTTATLLSAAPHLATNGGKVRVAGSSTSALNGTWTVTSVADSTHLTFTVPTGTASGAGGTVEPLGVAITMTATSTGFTGTWSTPPSGTRRIELAVADSGSLSTVIASNVTVTSNSPPIVAVVNPAAGGQLNQAAGQTIAAVVIDPNFGDTISAGAWAIKDSTDADVLAGLLAVQTPAVSTTLAADVADVSQLNGDPADTVLLTSATGATAPGVLAVAHGTGIVVLAYGGVSSNTLTNVTTLAGAGTLSSGDTARSANYTATTDCSALTAGATYAVQAAATDNHSALGASVWSTFTINTPPTVAWATPVAGQTLNGTVTLAVNVGDDGGSATCTGGLYNRDTGSSVLIGAFTVASDGTVTYPGFDTTTLTNKADHTLRARIVDSGGLVTTADVTFHVDQTDTTGPKITALTLTDGEVIADLTGFTVDLADPSGISMATPPVLRLNDAQGNVYLIPLTPQ